MVVCVCECGCVCVLSVCVVVCECAALVLQNAKRMRHITLSSVACPALQYFPTLSHKGRDLREKSYWKQNVCFDLLYKSV